MSRRLLLVFVLVWLQPTSALAVDPARRTTQYAHTAWRMQDGAFESPPNAIAQTADGYIWIGTDSGLMKYDGVRFVPWAPAGAASPFSDAVYSLLASSDGTLWIGTARGLVSWRNNTLQDYVRGRINSIVEDRQHRIWVARSRPPDSSGGLCQVDGRPTNA
jgi:Predicted periplasmic ligand-binding sensor domain